MKEMIAIADAVNSKIDRYIKTLENMKGDNDISFFITLLDGLKVWDIRINTDREVFVTFKDIEIMKIDI